MQGNCHPSKALFASLTAALDNGELEHAQDLLQELTDTIKSVSPEELSQNLDSFSTLNEQLLEAITTLESEKGLAKDQLSQYKANTKKLKAYTK
ncbi:hypothetical protein V1358_06400 [Pseudoalteromonas sp. YIC-656]|uniref:hypothetical protein n=1 Tax=Pseudoalteromonas pernae TaxID=3118054 RepID=UPI0032421A4A